LVLLLDFATASPSLCTSCHELQGRSHAWNRSAHRTVACVKCHLPARAWYAAPVRVADRLGLLQRDWRAHLAADAPKAVEARSPGTPPIRDGICLQCHDPDRKATSGFRIKIDHAAHARRNGSCVSCHVRTAHPLAARSNAMSLMTQCFTCHGLQARAKAPGECGVCHPAGYALKPASHKAASWRPRHGRVMAADPAQCEMCHRQQFCTKCHGLVMPHPAGWERGKTGHGPAAKVNRNLCRNCHEGGPDVCTMCHHSGFRPGEGTWVKQHFRQVSTDGMVRCLDCHSPLFCSDCHVRTVPRAGS
jgi:hypothetical protein